ncbi:peptidoglycan-binding protein [Allokutzneria albata]|uniref:Multidrug efflux pump subunit AcrA (Membrane-fusion protein) n=1 Tax=Allokutzneria albata TaxID=211114 RepID=A0A1H0BT38_ALLAB|nr:peptidoglycan-binding protein [Allokutzneria albata]SDN48812.1 Multidrug efflux pump subunit AcrA (membrane-fusion protein) [Allokutzneria albata]
MTEKQGRGGRRAAVVVGAAAVLAAGGITAAALLSGGDPAAANDSKSKPGATSEIEKTTLVQQEKVDGKLGFGGTYDVSAGGSGGGIYTSLPKEGQVVKQGQQLYSVNDRTVPLWRGDVPLWRKIASGMDKGSDVKIVEQNLRDLGFFKQVPDEKFNDATAAAIKKWQKALGVEQTGAIEVGDVVIMPSDIRMTKVDGTLGGPAQGKLGTASSTDRVVTVDMPVTKQSVAKTGGKVEVSLPGGKRAPGRVTSVGTVATKAEDDKGFGGSPPTVKVEVVLDDPNAVGTLDGAPVSVYFTSESKENVLAVPLNALLRLAEGGYGVELVQPDGSTKLVGVELGLFGNGKVEVTGAEIREGAKVRVAA